MAEAPEFEARKLSKAELAIITQMLRGAKGWTQETLADIAGVSTRTIQRLEVGQGAGADTLRAIARAMDAEDMDFLMRPQFFPTQAGLRKRAEEFERDNLLLDATATPTGRAVVAFMADLTMLSCVDTEVTDPESQGDAAVLFDDLRDYLDMKAEVSHQDRLAIAAELDSILARLRKAGWVPFTAVRHTKLMNDHWVDKTPWPVTIGYLTLLPRGQEPPKLAVPKRLRLE